MTGPHAASILRTWAARYEARHPGTFDRMIARDVRRVADVLEALPEVDRAAALRAGLMPCVCEVCWPRVPVQEAMF